MKTKLALSHVDATPGLTSRVDIEVTNTSTVIEGVTAIVDGINPEWVRLERPVVSLFPDVTDHVVLVFDIPPTCQAGDYLIDVRILSSVDPSIESVQDFWLTVAPVEEIKIDLRPTVVTGGSSAELTATIVNSGNSDLDVQVSVSEATREVDCTVDVPRLTIPFGHQAPLEVGLRSRRPWFGQPVLRPVLIEARSEDFVVEQQATFKQKPRIPQGLMTMLILAGIVLLWALIFLWAIGLLRASDPSSKSMATEIATGEANIPLVLINGTVGGVVEAASNGDPIPNATVEALRVATEPAVPGEPLGPPVTRLEPVASGASDDDGSYLLQTLIPGTYELRFSAPGFANVDPGTRRAIGPKDVIALPAVQMTGGTGSVQVKVDVPDGVDVSQLTATVSSGLDTGGGASGLVAQADSGTCTVQPAVEGGANIRCTNLVTPGKQTITVSGPGFETQRIAVELSAGADTVLDTVQLSGELGTIIGRVIDQDGQPLGGVAVTVSSGRFVTRVFSQTSDGGYLIDRLDTPNDYVVDFNLNGYTGETKALRLDAGASGVADARLVGGDGTVSGVVLDENGEAFGGVSVTVIGDSFRVATETLTNAGSAGGLGTYEISELGVPGSYSLEFSADGYQTETRTVEFLDAAAKRVEPIIMIRTVAEIRGLVVGPNGVGLGGVAVLLGDGLKTRQSLTSTNPVGTFTFPDVDPGSYSVTMTSTNAVGDVASRVVQVDVQTGVEVDLGTQQLDIVGAGSIFGSIVASDAAAGGEVVPVTISLTGENLNLATLSITDGVGGQPGRFQFGSLFAPGNYNLTFDAPGFAPTTQSITVPSSSPTDVGITSMRPLPGSVSGIVVLGTSGVGGATVELTATGLPTQTVISEASGVFAFPDVPRRTYDLKVTASAGESDSKIVVVEAGVAVAVGNVEIAQ
ncbi:MAG: hypothetical protein HOK58_00960 [Acidimicrobiaceae bacterium]|uniref:carboxypeptidase regulatory-like domain-containing protein n=1 Tax=Ilumatobacter sp. TaxID=1967498 RepID=UPI002A2D1A7E|nr:hypothetical protein [Acidimicrobiaceae bacterium]MDG0977422.1 carboxypeptidase regulatory-like domain-containing protein [Ilumatobacter sp.]